MSSQNQNQHEDRICICGSNSHLRRSHSDCPLNERNVRRRLYNNETVFVEEPEQPLESTSQRRSCSRCGSETHQRSSHRDCPYNSRNQSENQTTENQEPPVQNEPIETIEAEIIRTCTSCGSPSHSRRTFRLCPFNDANIGSDHGAEYQLACTLPFNPENVIGPNICYTPGENFHRHKLSRMDAICTFCNAQMWIEERITTSSKTHPLFSICCTHGKIVLPIPRCPPQQIIDLLTAEDEASNDFFTNIRAYNNMFAFASIRANFDRDLANRSGGVSTFRINGTMYHDIGSLRLEQQAPVLQAADEQPAEQEHLSLQQQHQPQQERPKFAQIYFADKEEQLATRETLFSGLRNETISTLQTVMQEFNPYARGLMNAHETYGDRPFGTLQVVIRSAANLGRRYDQQSYPEVAAMIVENTVDGESSPHEIVIRDRQAGLRTISSVHPSYIPLHYVLMFPFGDDGWSPGMQCQSADNQINSITLLKYCSYMLMIRNGSRTTYHHHFRRLFQQFVVDNYARIEFSRLQYVTNNQSDLRADLYNGIGDNVDPRQIGRSIILPSSFTGGPRYMKQMLQDGLAIIRQRGNPTLFITFTCNPQWPEIQSELLPGQQAFDRPDLCSRVFHMKITEMLAHIKESNCFGRVVGYVATVEFQKRGLPHVHILLILHHEDRPHNPADYDRFVCAELPNSATHPQLYRTVTSSMIHGPCGNLNPNAICMKDVQCSQGYPKPFVAETRVSRDGYPIYRRRENIHNRHHFQRSNFIADNSHVIPYNPYLCQKYNAHINVEICTSSRAIKYLCKYLTKGSDRAQIEVVQGRQSEAVRSTNATINTTHASNDIELEPIDEVTQFQNARYIGPCEAIWRTFEYQVHVHYPYVSRLALHLPNEQRVVFRSTDSANGLQAARNNAETTSLTAFFNLCSRDERARQYLYTEIPCHYTYDKRLRQWNPRTNPIFQNVVSRIYFASPSNMRLFSLRLLLLNVRGPVSFESLRTFNNVVYQTFEAAALARGLLESDDEWDRCLTEASIHAPSAASLRELFVYILTNCSPSEPHRLWNNHRERMSDDYFFEMHYQLPNNEAELVPDQWNQIYQRTLGDIDTRLQITGHRLSEFPSLPQDFVTAMDAHPQLTALEAVERSEYNTEEQTQIHQELFPTLNDDQRRAFNTIIQAIDGPGNQNQSHIFFVNGPGGTGKSLLFKTLLSRVRSQDQIALPVASSGIAAILLSGGRTAHSRFKIPIDADETATCNLPLGGAHAHLIRQTSLIIWDEAVMCGKWNFQAVDNALRDIMGATNPALANVPFGGKVVVFGGDFRQLLPVVKKGTRSEIVANCISATTFWRHVQILNLTVNMRVRNAGPAAAAFANTLLAVGDGRPPYSTSYEIPPDWLIDITDTATLINSIYPTISDPNPQPEHFSSHAILASTNADVDEINKCAFELFPGDTRQYLSTDRIIDADDPDVAAASYPTEYLQSLTSGGIPSHALNLKVGMPLILLRNLNPDAGLCNGTKVFVTALLDHSIVVKRIDIGHDGEEHYIPRINMCTTEGEYPFILCRRQFPVRPAFAMTIHKSQGQTLTHIGIRLQEPVFVHGQLYVALSRATDPNNIRIAIDMTKFSSTDIPTTVNIVYHEVLLPS